MNALRNELKASSIEVDFLAVNKSDAADYQEALAAQADFPMVQDTDDLGGWKVMGGGKDDFFLYHSDGSLAVHLPQGGTVSTALMTDAGYENVRAAAAALK